MKTTLMIDDEVMAHLKERAAREGRTISELVEAALRRLLETPRKPPLLRKLPSFRTGGALVDVADREALYAVMDEG